MNSMMVSPVILPSSSEVFSIVSFAAKKQQSEQAALPGRPKRRLFDFVSLESQENTHAVAPRSTRSTVYARTIREPQV